MIRMMMSIDTKMTRMMIIDITSIDDDFNDNMRVDPKNENTEESNPDRDTHVDYFPFGLRLSPASGQVK